MKLVPELCPHCKMADDACVCLDFSDVTEEAYTDLSDLNLADFSDLYDRLEAQTDAESSDDEDFLE